MDSEEIVHGYIEPVEIDHEMRTAYIDYSMSVIVSRALPDVRDGLKPVQRRVLFGMDGLGLSFSGQTKKSARIVGEVLGKYHPHGDSSVYDAMARLAQPWNQRYPLVFGQGNFGSMDGDPVAAMRYTEAKLAKMTEDILADLDKDTVDMTLNFDDSLQEPTVLPTKLPLLLLNGSSGIAVGMATNMAPHNLGEVCDAICAYIDNPDITTEELMEYVKGPDFPTGGIIMGRQGIIDAYNTGRGKVVVRAKTEIEVADNGRETIVVTEIPYMVNKRDMIAHIGELVRDKKIEGIADLLELTNREGIRIEIPLKMGANSNVVLNTLFKYTALQSSFAINNVALVGGRPRTLSLKEMIQNFVQFRHEVVVRRTKFELDKALKRAHILEGLLKAIDVIDEIVAIIRRSASVDDAKSELIATFGFTPSTGKSYTHESLYGLAKDANALVSDRTVLYNRIQRHLDITFPELLGFLRENADGSRRNSTRGRNVLGSPTTRWILSNFPSARAVSAMTEADYAALKRASHSSFSPIRFARMKALAASSVGTPIAHDSAMVAMLAAQCGLIDSQLASIESEMEGLLASEPHEFTKIKGIGPGYASAILGCVGDFSRFPTADALLKYSGMVPSLYQSGTVERRGRMEKKGPPLLRYALVQAAQKVVLHYPKWAEYYRRKCSEGKYYKVALVHLAAKLLRTIWLIETRGLEFDEARF